MDVPNAEPLDEGDPTRLGPYTMLGRLGDGGMGTVYLARQDEDEQYVALKIIRADLARVPEFRARFLREAQAARRVARFCTAEVLDVSTEGRRPYLVTEFIDGPTLSAAVRDHGPLPANQLERLAVSVASALTAIHSAGLVHRDLKPGNIMMSDSGARVIDFGIARALDATTMLTHSGIGTPAFMAPEQALGQPVTPAADVYAWGGVVLFAGTGRLPFGEGPTPVILYRAVNEEPDLTGLTGGLRSLVERAMRKDPTLRPSAHDLFLRLVSGQQTVNATPVAAVALPPVTPPPVDPPFTAPGWAVPAVPLAPHAPSWSRSDPSEASVTDGPAAAMAPSDVVSSADLPVDQTRLTHEGLPTVAPPTGPPSGGDPSGTNAERPWPRQPQVLAALVAAIVVLAATVTAVVLKAGTGGGRPETVVASLAESSAPSPSPSSGGIQCAAGTISGEGSTVQKNAVDEWVSAYQSACSDATVNYQGTGSSAGRQQFIERHVTFAGSDSALKEDQKTEADARCAGGAAIDLPMAISPVAVVFNVPGVDTLRLAPATLARIFSGESISWNDPAVTVDNPNAVLPDLPILSVHRSDGSGTTDRFTSFLTGASGNTWAFDSGSDWKAPGGQGAKGGDGVTATVQSTVGAIGYVDFAYAENAGLSTAEVQNAAGEFVAVSIDGATRGVSTAKIADGNDLVLTMDYTTAAPGVYPIYLVTYEITCTKGLPSAAAALVKLFLTYTASAEGQAAVADLGYAPLPTNLASRVQAVIATLS